MKHIKSQKFRRTKFIRSIRLFLRRIFDLIQQPIFISLTVFGNLVILVGASLLYHVEFGINPHIKSLLDTIWWAAATVTTVGYGDVIPVTDTGKVIGLVMMIIGTALFWSFTALFADALISKEIFDLEDELRSIQKLLSRIDQSDIHDRSQLHSLIENLEKQLKEIKEQNQ